MKLARITVFLGMCLIHPVVGGWERQLDEKFEMLGGATPEADTVHRNLLTEAQNLNLQRIWWNWNFCTSARYKEEFVPMNSLVPKNTVFLAGFNACEEAPPTRTGTIRAGQKTVFFPVYNAVTAYDLNDDYKLGRDGCLPSVAVATYARYSVAFSALIYLSDPIVSGALYARLDGEPLEIFYLIEDAVPLLKECPDKQTTKEYEKLAGNPVGEVCDAQPFSRWGGLDYGPMHGWWGSVTRTWVVGDIHTFEFGGGVEDGNCPNAIYELTVVK